MNDQRFDDAREGLLQSTYNLEVLGDMVRSEARELRSEMQRLYERRDLIEAEERLSEVGSRLTVIASKLNRDVEYGVRVQIDIIREQTTDLRSV